ncbi:DUF192 domain-containing protein [Novosphingobium sp. FGD1]|uniref:DUF192 domain-containing protein n=1 Tax=Novosphingobium silvae TaxID=2692619 RepID=A0A7X4GFP7_9SPHN|nr:DUF192 domain-containing protein [Novosphingobium silvae]MYL97396.1 DUF192 domain-containing protein [Novosphingobium silvae]
MRLTHTSRTGLAAAVLLAFAACSQGGAPADAKPSAKSSASAARHPESGLAIIPLSVKSANGTHAFRVEVATTPQEQAKGLMFRTQMGADEGMVFVNKPPRPASFWMRNTVIPLDIIFVGTDHRILNIAANAQPYDESPVSSTGVTSAVLELNGGRAAQLGIKPGDKVSW